MDVCQQCGGVGCEERFHGFLALEYTDERYGVVHHLTVPAYMLQHPQQLSREAWRMMRETLRTFLVEGVSPAQRRKQVREKVDSGARSWSMRKGPRMMLPEAFAWSETISGVDSSTPEQYCKDVEAWARSVLVDAETL